MCNLRSTEYNNKFSCVCLTLKKNLFVFLYSHTHSLCVYGRRKPFLFFFAFTHINYLSQKQHFFRWHFATSNKTLQILLDLSASQKKLLAKLKPCSLSLCYLPSENLFYFYFYILLLFIFLPFLVSCSIFPLPIRSTLGPKPSNSL